MAGLGWQNAFFESSFPPNHSTPNQVCFPLLQFEFVQRLKRAIEIPIHSDHSKSVLELDFDHFQVHQTNCKQFAKMSGAFIKESEFRNKNFSWSLSWTAEKGFDLVRVCECEGANSPSDLEETVR